MKACQMDLFTSSVTVFHIRKKYEVRNGSRFTALDSAAKEFCTLKAARKELKAISPSLSKKARRMTSIQAKKIIL